MIKWIYTVLIPFLISISCQEDTMKRIYESITEAYISILLKRLIILGPVPNI